MRDLPPSCPHEWRAGATDVAQGANRANTRYHDRWTDSSLKTARQPFRAACVGLAQPLALVSRDRLLNEPGLRLVWGIALEGAEPRPEGYLNIGLAARPEPVMALAIQLLMLTLTRRNEVAGARKAESDLDAALWSYRPNGPSCGQRVGR